MKPQMKNRFIPGRSITVYKLLLIVGMVTSCPVTAVPLFSDNFDSYNAGFFPVGWTLLFDGAGDSQQYVDNTLSVSSPNSLHLKGSSCWSSSAYHPVNMPVIPNSLIILKGKVSIEANVPGGCDNGRGSFSLWNPSTDTWGAAYGYVYFASDGYMWSGAIKMMPYSPKTWYDIRIEVNLSAKTFNTFINDVLKASNQTIVPNGLPTGISLQAIHGEGSVMWFDDIVVESKVLELSQKTPKVGAAVTGFQGEINALCQNDTTGQNVNFTGTGMLDCKAKGLVVNNGDSITLTLSGKANSFARHRYEVIADCGDWFSCKAAAESRGAHLVTLGSRDEKTFVFNQFKQVGNYWIGLSDHISEGNFQWVTGEPVSYLNWSPGQPDALLLKTDCTVTITTGQSSKWNDINCYSYKSAVIEYE